MAQPYYMLHFSAGCCMFQIRINDVPVMTLNLPGQAASVAPVNFAILKSGKQSIKATMLPHPGELSLNPAAFLEFELKLYDTQREFVFKEQLLQQKFPAVDQAKPIPAERYQNEFSATVPYDLQGWENGRPLKDVEDVGIKLRAAHERIGKMISRKDYDGFKKLIAAREHIMCTSMYLDQGQANARVGGLIEDFESGFEMAPLAADAIVHLCGGGKTAALKKPNGEPALYLLNEQTREELMLDLMFYVPAGKTEFEVI
ncbi:hypothetical protein [Pedobacter nutrimenti]|uniref:Uncharacterized protein n=1 Tax=Pedobacter nutrimenti TaxID=1241337 RepID=A0A318UGI8_9SPHI|nr:hypothetical protein [Pedobacter nutrimenti]PYF75472.1 hypothetical protein B0O44_10221 [Pedobacter nutrimenti]